MEKPDCYEAGKVIKTFGYKGELILFIRKEFQDAIMNEGCVFIETDEELVPYFFEQVEKEGDETFLVRFDDIYHNDRAKEMNAAVLWVPKTSMPDNFLETNPLQGIEGYSVRDMHLGEIGIVKKILDLPGHSVLAITKGRKEILLPLAGDFIKKVNRKEKSILIEAPEGLIESYLG